MKEPDPAIPHGDGEHEEGDGHRQPEQLEQEQHQAGKLSHGPKAGQERHQHKAQHHGGGLNSHHQADCPALLHALGDHVHHGFHPALGGHQRVHPGNFCLGQPAVLLAQPAV